MEKHYRILPLVAALLLAIAPTCAQDFMMQGWYWDYPKPNCNGYSGPSLASEMAGRAAAQRAAGFTMMWMPPLVQASFGDCSNGYDPQDLYDYGQVSGATGLGTGAEVEAWIAALQANNMLPVADVVYNHRDGGDWENNPAVRDYILNYPNGAGCSSSSATPYPVNGKMRYMLPLGGSSGNGAGDYYFKFASASGQSGFDGRAYKLFFRTTSTGFTSPDIMESEPNGGGDCGQPFDQVFLGRDVLATQETTTGCNTDEFYLQLNASDFDAAGDQLEIYIEQVGGGGTGIDVRLYDLYSVPRAASIINDVQFQTRTNFNGMPSGQGGMNWRNFKPNGNIPTCMSGDLDFPFFFFDVEQAEATTGTTYDAWNKWLWNTVGMRGFRMDAVKHFPAWFAATLLNDLHAAGINPPMVVGEHFTVNAGVLRDWVDQVYASMTPGAASAIDVRAFDFELRAGLKNACENGLYDVRNLYNIGMVNGQGMNGRNVVSFINNHDYRSGPEHVLQNLQLAYAYILTNNQIGLPSVFYPDYYGVDIYGSGYPFPDIQSDINNLMQVHRTHIAGASFVDYLNRVGTPYGSAYLESGPFDCLLYQLQNTPSGRDVIVAINFENAPLRVNHTINTANAPLGTAFNLIAGNANFTNPMVENSPNGVPNSLYFDIPAYSYAVFLQQSNAPLPVTLTHFEARAKGRAAQLKWSAASETAFQGYEVQRSTDGRDFSKIAWVAGKGGQQSADYQLTDSGLSQGQAYYYRLKMVDLDGSYELSPVRKVRIAGSSPVLNAFPNPATGRLTLTWSGPDGAIQSIRLLDSAGREVRQLAVQPQANAAEIALKGLPNGLYTVILQQADGQWQSTRVLKTGA